ncbi:MAG: hypothetical protein AB7Q00_04240 [Phycisphaerales bacterium]|nr:MAG: hypothetical protein IPK69_08855 [Phycisphaerales bacterium]
MNQMRRASVSVALATLGMAALSGFLGGCRTVPTDPTMGRYTPAVDAACRVQFSGERADVLEQIAAKPDLEECDQLRIVHCLSSNSGFSEDHTRVLATLVRNPATTVRTRQVIGAHLDQIVAFSEQRAEIARLLSDNPPDPIQPEPAPQP